MNAPEQSLQKSTAPENRHDEIPAMLERIEEILCAIHNLLLDIKGRMP